MSWVALSGHQDKLIEVYLANIAHLGDFLLNFLNFTMPNATGELQ